MFCHLNDQRLTTSSTRDTTSCRAGQWIRQPSQMEDTKWAQIVHPGEKMLLMFYAFPFHSHSTPKSYNHLLALSSTLPTAELWLGWTQGQFGRELGMMWGNPTSRSLYSWRGWKIWLKSQSQGPLAAHPARIIEKMPSYIGKAEGKLLGFNEEGGRISSEAVVILENKRGWSFLNELFFSAFLVSFIIFTRCWVSFTMMWPSDLNTFPEIVKCF